MDTMLRHLHFVHCYIDDILVASKNEGEHEHHLLQIFNRLRKYRLQIDIAKCVLRVTDIKYLGYLINSKRTRKLSYQST
jgi:hypothetical protein